MFNSLSLNVFQPAQSWRRLPPDYIIPVSSDYSFSLLSLVFLIVLAMAFMFKLRWAYSPSVGEDLHAIREDIKIIKEYIIHD